MQLVMPVREEWKSGPVRVDLQAVVVGEIKRVIEAKLFIILLWTVRIHIARIWNGLEIKE